MSDDLQDFLARAAKRRAEKAQQERGEKARSETRQARADVNSQYSDRRRERVIRLEEDEEEVVDAIMVDEPVLEASIVRESVSDQPVAAQGLANDKQRPGFGRSVTHYGRRVRSGKRQLVVLPGRMNRILMSLLQVRGSVSIRLSWSKCSADLAEFDRLSC